MFDAAPTQRNLNAYGAGLTIDGRWGPMTMQATLSHAAQRNLAKLASPFELARALVARLPDAEITTPLRLRHFLAQCACETAGFTRLVENDGGDPGYFARYEHNTALGNTQPGDGARYRGRGLLDTTGRWNYSHLAKLAGLDCIAHPELLEQPDAAVKAAVCYWADKGCNAPADDNDLRAVTHLVNGGYNGLADRGIYLERLAGVVK